MNALIKGFNCPIVLLTENDLTGVSDFHAQLTDAAGGKLLEWDMDSAVIEAGTVILPVKQAESLLLPAGRALVTAEWNISGKPKGGTQPAPILIADYPDKSILGSDDPVTEYSAAIPASDLPDPWDLSADQLRTAIVIKVSGGGYDDTELRQLIADESTARAEADSKQTTDMVLAVKTEAGDRAAADHNEAQARAAADSSLQAYLEAETETRAEAVSAEAAAREAADAEKANAADVYTKTEADTLLAKKANSANVYSKTAADGRYVKKTDYASDSSDGILHDTDYMMLEAAYKAAGQLAEKADKDHTHTVDQITDFPAIPEGWTELTYGTSTLEEVAAAWPECYLKYKQTDAFYYVAMPASDVNGGAYSFAVSLGTTFNHYEVNSEGWRSWTYNFPLASSLKAVAFTGSYNDLTDKPTIPTVSNDFTDTYKEEVDTLWSDYRMALTLIGGETG